MFDSQLFVLELTAHFTRSTQAHKAFWPENQKPTLYTWYHISGTNVFNSFKSSLKDEKIIGIWIVVVYNWLISNSNVLFVGKNVVYLWFTKLLILKNSIFNAEERSVAISAPIWGLGPEGSSARLLSWFLKNQRNEEAKQEGRIQSKSWKWGRAHCSNHHDQCQHCTQWSPPPSLPWEPSLSICKILCLACLVLLLLVFLYIE